MPKRKKVRKPQKKGCRGKEVQVKKRKQYKKDEDVTNKLTVENDIDDIVKNEQALFHAAESGNDTELSELLELGVSTEIHLVPSLNYSVKHAIMPLQVAAVNGHVKCVEVLIAHRANLDAKDKFECTALHFAAAEGNYLCLKLLLEAGANCNVPITLPLIKAVPPYAGGTTALHLAAEHNHVKCAEELIKFGANCDAVDENGHTSLYIAAKAGFSECVLAHLRNGKCSTIISLPSHDTSDTPLHHAVEKKMELCVRELVRLGADVNHINKNGYSPLHLLCSDYVPESAVHMEILKHLVLNGHKTDVNKMSRTGLTALFYLANSNCMSAISFLITHGADINIRGNDSEITFLESLLICYYRRSFNILNCIINCVPQLRRLKSLNISFPTVAHPDNYCIYKYGIWRDSVLPENVEFYLFRTKLRLYVAMLGGSETVCDTGKFKVIPLHMLYPLQDPLLSLIYECVIDELKYRNDKPKNSRKSSLSHLSAFQLHRLKVQLWYEQIASTPRSLKHYCRLSVLKERGFSKSKDIRELPLPKELHSYLLFECENEIKL